MTASPPGNGAPDTAHNHLQGLGLNGYEARVLVALLKKGSATARELAELSGVGRTNIYPVLESLRDKHLAQAISGKVVTWTASGTDEVVDRLSQAERQRVRQLEDEIEVKRAAAAEALAGLGADLAPGPLPFAQVLATAAEVKRAYDRLMQEALDETLVMVAPPYSFDASKPSPASIDALRRGVRGRALYETSYVEDPEAEPVLTALEDYLDAGLEVRVVSAIPMKIAVYDRRAAIVSMLDPSRPATTYPTSLLVEHRGFAGFQADAFEAHWVGAQPYERPVRRRRRGRGEGARDGDVDVMVTSEPASSTTVNASEVARP